MSSSNIEIKRNFWASTALAPRAVITGPKLLKSKIKIKVTPTPKMLIEFTLFILYYETCFEEHSGKYTNHEITLERKLMMALKLSV